MLGPHIMLHNQISHGIQKNQKIYIYLDINKHILTYLWRWVLFLFTQLFF